MSDAAADIERDTAIEVAAWGVFNNLIVRLRSGVALDQKERDAIADILENKTKKKGNPTTLFNRGRNTAIAMQVAIEERESGSTEGAVHKVAKDFGVNRSTVFRALKTTEKRFAGFAAGRKKRLDAVAKTFG